ncbi:MAG: trimeric intracellular cation channel family protein [Sporichthyaceae bacterium]
MLATLDLLGVVVFALSGGLVAVRRELDVVGVVVLATATALGGGLIRDVLIGDVPPPALDDWRYLAAAMAAGLVAFFCHPTLGRLERPITILDAGGLGLFCVAGALKADDYGLSPLPAAILGALTGVGGGVLRDVLVREVPAILRKGELYAIPAFVGAGIAVAGRELGSADVAIAIVGAGVAAGWRITAHLRGWHAPMPGPGYRRRGDPPGPTI